MSKTRRIKIKNGVRRKGKAAIHTPKKYASI
jgi:hypothetical protein